MIQGVMPMSLVDILVENVARKIDIYYMKPYVSGNFRLSLEVKPKFGELAMCNAKVSKRIIEYLIETESLKPIHLMVLLDNSVTHLPCNENSPYSPFTVAALIVISRRCKNFQEVHFHSDLRTEKATWKPKQIKSHIDGSLKNLSTSVTVLNFRDAYIDKTALKTICTSFKSLRVLNLHQALIEKDDFEILVCPECVIKETVENLRIDKTSVSVVCTAKCLVLYTKLTYFRSDRTLTALFLERTKRNISSSFKTTVLEQNFKSYNSIISDAELGR
ncbi:hypothetical protein Anas_06517 [Armadillidium nasatum]|uniref:Uncharacterized protein n=1 Tax=Armadillidium nasatum TaxID=96803 RepID=A0A5N5STQ5_9CRUS|nr:hypothetical protein Anas_06517 [Armadillidium nasatum]